MAQIGCACGARISDTTDSNPAKARFVRDVDVEMVEDGLVDRWSGYMEAALAGTAKHWLRDAGYGADYIALDLSHAEILSDMMGRESQFDMFECAACGRLLVENADNRFVSYVPEAGTPLSPFRKRDT